MINNRLGLTRDHDCLPEALQIPFEDDVDGEKGYVPDFESMLREYYHVRGWNHKTGYPSREKLMQLGLGWIDFNREGS